MNDQLKILVELPQKFWKAKEEKKEALQEALHLALRRAMGLRVEVEL